MSEGLTRSAPLGVRLCDAATGATVADGLRVWVESEEDPALSRPSTPGRDGLHVWHSLPGLERWSRARADFSAARHGWVLRAEDLQGRYLPMALRVEAPTQGLVRRRWGAEKQPRPAVQLARSLAAPPVEGFASVSAELLDGATGAPAAWALVGARASSGGGAAAGCWGLADESGQVVVALAWPEPTPGSSRPIAEAQWTLTLRVRYGRLSRDARGRPPTLDAIEAQPVAHLWRDRAASRAFASATLHQGRPLVLRGEGPQGPGPLVITI